MTMHDRSALLGPLHRKDAGGAPSGETHEVKAAVEALARTFEAFKAKNDENLAEIAKKKIDDVVLREHVDRINAGIDEALAKRDAEILELKRKAILGADSKGGEAMAPELVEYRAAFNEYIRKGGDRREEVLRAAEAKAVEAKALATTSEADGGFTVIPMVDQAIRELQLLVSPVRSVAQVQQIGAGSLKVLANKRGTTTGWVGEADPRAQTSTSQLAEIEIVPGELYAMPAATQQMLEDSFINVEAWIANEVALAMAVAEGKAFINGDGVKKPKGFLTENVVADASWAWGSLGYIASGASGDLTTPSGTAGTGGDPFFDMIAALKYPYRPNARFAMNRRTVARLRKLKTTYADYLWVPGLQNGQPDSFAGYPITEMEDMPDIGANSYSVALGDWRQFYLIVDRVGVSVLRDPYTAKPYVLYYTRKRVGGRVQNFEAVKLMKFSVS